MVVDGWGVHPSLLSAGTPFCGGGFNRSAAGERQDLQGPLGDGGRVGIALFIHTDVVHVIPKQASVALQGDARLQWERKAMFLTSALP